MVKEIITLQFGHYANYVGAHYWNIEEAHSLFDRDDQRPELSPETVWRVSQLHNGELTHTPRAVMYDLAGSLGSISDAGTLEPDVPILDRYAPTVADRSQPTWNGGVERHQISADSNGGNWRQQLSGMLGDGDDATMDLVDATERKVRTAHSLADDYDTQESSGTRKAVDAGLMPSRRQMPRRHVRVRGPVESWTDYLVPHLHSKNIALMRGIHHRVNAFDYFTQGAALLETRAQEDDALDRMRYLAEECDTLQGVQCFVDVDSAFGGFAARYLECLKDDYERTPVLVFGVTPHIDARSGATPKDFDRRSINTALALSSFTDTASLYVPLSSQYWQAKHFGNDVHFDVLQPYHTAALLAAGIHTATAAAQSSVLAHQTSLRQLCTGMTPFTKLNVAMLSMTLPLDKELETRFDAQFKSLLQPSTHEAHGADDAVTPVEPFHSAGFMTSLSPYRIRANSPLIAEWSALRGSKMCSVPAIDAVLRARRATETEIRMRCWEPFLQHIASSAPCANRNASYIDEPMPIPALFPDVFNPVPDPSSDKGDVMVRPHAPVATDLFTSPALYASWGKLAEELDAISQRNYALVGQYAKHGMVGDRWKELGEHLRVMADEYRTAGPR